MMAFCTGTTDLVHRTVINKRNNSAIFKAEVFLSVKQLTYETKCTLGNISKIGSILVRHTRSPTSYPVSSLLYFQSRLKLLLELTMEGVEI